MPDPFAPRGPNDVCDLIAAYPLAWLIAHAAKGAPSIMLPMVPERGSDGALAGLLGHLPRAHPLTDCWRDAPEVLALFHGPQGYLSPSWLSNRNWAPTWAYAAVRIDGVVHLQPERTDEALERLVTAMEHGRKSAWSMPEMGDRYERLARRVIGFTIDVREVRARFRLGQDEQRDVWRELVANTPDPSLAAWMRRFGEPVDR